MANEENSQNETSSLDELRSIAHKQKQVAVESKRVEPPQNRASSEADIDQGNRSGSIKLVFRTLAILALAGIGYTWITIIASDEAASEQQDKPPIAQSVEALAADVIEVRNSGAPLPDNLSDLPSFPVDGIEWDIEQYQLVMRDPRPEFFFIPNTVDGFVIVGRYMSDSWQYLERLDPPLEKIRTSP